MKATISTVSAMFRGGVPGLEHGHNLFEEVPVDGAGVNGFADDLFFAEGP